MSFFESLSNAFNNHEYDFDEAKLDDDEDKEHDDRLEGSDEDTEDASETDTGNAKMPTNMFSCIRKIRFVIKVDKKNSWKLRSRCIKTSWPL